MTVAELIKELSEYDQSMRVIVSNDDVHSIEIDDRLTDFVTDQKIGPVVHINAMRF